MIIIVTGTDTGVGKTVAAAALAVHCGPDAVVVKPAQTGIGTDEADSSVVARLAGCHVVEFTQLVDPLAPDTAARLRGVEVAPISEYADRIRELTHIHRTVIVEGAGGLLVRLDTDGGTLADLAADLARDHLVRTYVVTRVGLGTLNHTALTVDMLRARGLEPAGLVLGAVPQAPDLAARCNVTELPRVTAVPVVAALPEGAGALARHQFRQRVGTWLAQPDQQRSAVRVGYPRSGQL